MTVEKITPEVPANQQDDFKIFFAVATNGILGSIPFGVTVDPNAVAQAAKNTAVAMLKAQAEAFGE